MLETESGPAIYQERTGTYLESSYRLMRKCARNRWETSGHPVQQNTVAASLFLYFVATVVSLTAGCHMCDCWAYTLRCGAYCGSTLSCAGTHAECHIHWVVVLAPFMCSTHQGSFWLYRLACQRLWPLAVALWVRQTHLAVWEISTFAMVPNVSAEMPGPELAWYVWTLLALESNSRLDSNNFTPSWCA